MPKIRNWTLAEKTKSYVRYTHDKHSTIFGVAYLIGDVYSAIISVGGYPFWQMNGYEYKQEAVNALRAELKDLRENPPAITCCHCEKEFNGSEEAFELKCTHTGWLEYTVSCRCPHCFQVLPEATTSPFAIPSHHTNEPTPIEIHQ